MRTLKLDFRADNQPLGTIIPRRRATPSFKDTAVPDEIIEELLELATLAPSGYNLQPWRFIVVRELKDRQKLRKAAMDQPKVEQAPVVVIACGDTQGWEGVDMEKMLEHGKKAGYIKNEQMAQAIKKNAVGYLKTVDLDVWVTRQTMIAFTHLMLAAESLGLDTAPMEGFWEDKVQQAFGIPEHVKVVALLALGYGQPPDKPYGGRFDLDSVVFDGAYGKAWRAGVAPGRR